MARFLTLIDIDAEGLWPKKGQGIQPPISWRRVFLPGSTNSNVVRGLWGTDPPDPTLESTSPSPPQGSIWHRCNIDSTLIRHRNRVKSGNRCRINVESMLHRCQIDPWGGEGEVDSRVGSGGSVPHKPLTTLTLKFKLNLFSCYDFFKIALPFLQTPTPYPLKIC